MSDKIKQAIVDKFSITPFSLSDPIPLDKEIADFIFDLNRNNSYIVTTNSCAGHPERQYHPYLAFLLSEKGWDLFWGTALPEIAAGCLVHISALLEEKTAIVLRAHFEDKDAFWITVQAVFRKTFIQL